jgi:hypothetical protein
VSAAVFGCSCPKLNDNPRSTSVRTLMTRRETQNAEDRTLITPE